MVALEGQHTGWLTKAFSKERPSWTNKEPISGIFWAEAKSRSSAITKIMLGGSAGDSASSCWDVSACEIPDPEQPATRRRKTDRQARTPKDTLLFLAPKDLSPLLVTMKLPLFYSQPFSVPNMISL